MRYMPDTDMIQILVDESWTDWKKAGFKEPIAIIPIMSSNTCDVCTVSASNQTGANAYNAFDQNTLTRWWTNQNCIPAWLQIAFVEPKIVRKYSVYLGEFSPSTMRLQASNDASNWVDLTSDTVINTQLEETIENDVAYKYYRFYITSSYAAAKYGAIVEAQLYE